MIMRWHDIEVTLEMVARDRKPVVVLDLDDVVFDTMSTIVKYVNIAYDRDYHISQARLWSIEYSPWVKDGTMTFMEAVEVFRIVAKQLIPLRTDAYKGIMRMLEKGAQVMFLTKRTVYIEQAAIDNLRKYGLGNMPFINAPFEKGGKHRVLHSLVEKGGHVLMFVDDSPYNLEETHRMGFPVVKWNMPYNKTAPSDFTVSSWSELVVLFEYLLHKYLMLFFA